MAYAGSEVDGAKVNYKAKYQQSQQTIKDRYAYFEVPHYGKDNDDYVNGGGFCCNDNTSLRSFDSSKNDNPELYQFYYHSDHLGSTSLITNLDGEIVQHIEYVPFGEVFIEERNNKWNTPFLFNAKELDEETGLYYYGARYYDPRVSLWLSTDPLQEKYPNISTYAYTFQNPVKFIDPTGMEGEEGGPTEKEAARMSAHVYGDQKDDILIGGWKQKEKFAETPNGFKSTLYERKTKAGDMEYVLATAGTEDWEDTKADALQLAGLSTQYRESVSMAKALKLKYDNLSFTGHSLGGGLATVNALVTGGSAKTFNAAGVGSLTQMQTGTYFASAKIDAYIMMTDPLNAVQHLIDLKANGERHYRIPTDWSSVYNGHSMDHMVKPTWKGIIKQEIGDAMQGLHNILKVINGNY